MLKDYSYTSNEELFLFHPAVAINNVSSLEHQLKRLNRTNDGSVHCSHYMQSPPSSCINIHLDSAELRPTGTGLVVAIPRL